MSAEDVVLCVAKGEEKGSRKYENRNLGILSRPVVFEIAKMRGEIIVSLISLIRRPIPALGMLIYSVI